MRIEVDLLRLEERSLAERASVEARCEELVSALASEHDGIAEAIRYSLLGGGKRLRPILCLWSHDLVGGKKREIALDVACAIECIHTYSLIHDDLPCMDNDDFRRGKPSAHRKYGEATAVLTGDALLTLGFQVIGTIPERRKGADAGTILEAIRILAAAAGTGGLIAGQALDLSGSARTGNLDDVGRIHRNKTARLIAAAMDAGALVGGASMETRRRIRDAGTLAGEAFQIIDDVLDRETDRETLGKTPGKDALNDKLTFPAVAGAEKARETAAKMVAEAKSMLPEGATTGLLRAMFDFLITRAS